jgi:CheY-like chemotaxis protein
MAKGQPSVLLVDDDRNILWTFGLYLLRAGFRVTSCLDGAEAMSELGARDFDILITDLMMPKVDGLALIDWAREHRKDMRVILITGFGSRAIRNLSKSKSVAYLEKPVDFAELTDLMTDMLPARGRQGLSTHAGAVDFLEYLRLMVMCNRQSVLDVTGADGRRFRVYINKGKIEHAEGEGLTGEQALMESVRTAGKTFVSVAWTDPPQVSISKSGRQLLSDAARVSTSLLENAN